MLIFGYVKLFKSLNLGYKNNDLRVYLHLLLSANYTTNNFNGMVITAGQLITSYQSVSEKLGLTKKEVMVAVQHLVDNKMIKWKGLPSRFTLCTITNYKLQSDNTAYNYTKLYRNIQAFSWYNDDIVAKLYYYILINYTADGCRFRPVDVQLDLNITKKQYSRAIKQLSDSGAIVINTQCRYTIAKIVGEKEDIQKEKKDVVVKEIKEEKEENKAIGYNKDEDVDMSNIVLF